MAKVNGSQHRNPSLDSSFAPQYLSIEDRDRLIIQLTKEVTDLRAECAGLRIENEQLKKDLNDALPERDKASICTCTHTSMYHRVSSRGQGVTLGGCMGRECRCLKYNPAHA